MKKKKKKKNVFNLFVCCSAETNSVGLKCLQFDFADLK